MIESEREEALRQIVWDELPDKIRQGPWLTEMMEACMAMIHAALARQSAPQQEPVTIRAIVSCLEGSAGNTDTSPKWRAASELRRIVGWETATLPIASPPAQPDVVRDALRLDWLDAQWPIGTHLEVCAANDGRLADSLGRFVTVFAGNAILKGPNVRAAIDAAMQPAQGEKS